MTRTAGRWRVFTAAHRRRYGLRRQIGRPLALTLRLVQVRSAGAASTRVSRYFVWSPRLTVRVGLGGTTRPQMIHRVPHRPGSAGRPHTGGVTAQALAPRRDGVGRGRGATASVPATAVERVFARAGTPARTPARRTIVEWTRRSLTLSSHARVEARLPGVARVVHAARAEAAVTPPSSGDDRGSRPGSGPLVHPSPLAAAAATEAGVNALTERVIRQIDRRLLAYRERLGRPS